MLSEAKHDNRLKFGCFRLGFTQALCIWDNYLLIRCLSRFRAN